MNTLFPRDNEANVRIITEPGEVAQIQFHAPIQNQDVLDDFRNTLRALGLDHVFKFRLRDGQIQYKKYSAWTLLGVGKTLRLYGIRTDFPSLSRRGELPVEAMLGT